MIFGLTNPPVAATHTHTHTHTQHGTCFFRIRWSMIFCLTKTLYVRARTCVRVRVRVRGCAYVRGTNKNTNE